MFTGVNASRWTCSLAPIRALLHGLVTPDSRSLAYTGRMRATRSIHLLIAAAILFSQIVSGIHMAGHVHAVGPLAAVSSAQAPLQLEHPAGLTPAEHKALHLQGKRASSLTDSPQSQASLDQSCVIYHVYAGSHCAAAGSAVFHGATPVALPQQELSLPLLLTQRPEHNAIRGPPAFS